MYMAGVSSDEELQQAKDILIPLGEYFQIQVRLSGLHLTYGRTIS
jgi:hypothetical protein